MTNTNDRINKNLQAAADLLREKGWRQDHFAYSADGRMLDRDADGIWYDEETGIPYDPVCFCALGVIAEVTDTATNEVHMTPEAKVLARRVDPARIAGDLVKVLGIPDWNDDADRTKDEVIAALEGEA